MISVQNLVLRSMSLTLRTTCPIFLILMGDFSSAIGFLLQWFANWFPKPTVDYAHPDRRLSIMETKSRQNTRDSQRNSLARYLLSMLLAFSKTARLSYLPSISSTLRNRSYM